MGTGPLLLRVIWSFRNYASRDSGVCGSLAWYRIIAPRLNSITDSFSNSIFFKVKEGT